MAALLAAPAAARQAISVSLAECAVIYEEMSYFSGPSATEERRRLTANLSWRFAETSVDEAAREGVVDPATHTARWMERHRGEWRGRLHDLSQFEENRDWLDYCRALGRDRGIDGPWK